MAIGFFLDGEDAQQPMIMNLFPKYDNVKNTVIEHGVDQYVPNVKVIIDGHRYNVI